MNKRVGRFLALCLPILLLFAGCQPADKSVIPVTGGESAPVPAQVEMARENILEYVISSSRLATAPPSADWQLDGGEQREGEYRFRSGDWLMVIWLVDSQEGKQRVIIVNKVEKASWCGYVEPDGHVVDTAYTR